MAKDRGWDYLSSSGDDFEFDKENDGSWGYENEDGSGSFYGNDGSWGYKNSDGSASYYGADGSWGYKNSDGSTSYYGNDGSWGYRNSDGSGSFYGNDNDSEFYSLDDEYDDSDESSGGNLLGAVIGLGIVGIAAALAGRNSDSYYSSDDDDDDDDDESYYDSEAYRQLREEQARQRAEEEARAAEERRLKSEERKAKRKKFWGTITRKKVSPSLTAIQCRGMKYEDVVNAFKGKEFFNITTVKSEDLTIDRIGEEGLVDIVRIDGSNDFDITSVYYFGAKIEIVYHTLMRITLPFTSRNAKKRNVDDVIQSLISEGFVNVEKQPLTDLTTGWIKKDGAVESISVDGRTDYKKGDKYRLDARIIVTYHTFKRRT